MKKTFIGWVFVFCLAIAPLVFAQEKNSNENAASEPFSSTAEPFSELNLFALPYGYASSPIDIHVYLSIQYWDYEYQALGAYANQGHAATGHSNIIPYSGYIDLSSQIRKDMKVEAEFELYKGDSLKICRLRGVWQPAKYLAISLGRDFGIIGLQEELYYPTSKYKLFTIPPFLHWSIIRYTGWWDTGAFLYSEIPFKVFSETGKVFLDASVTNGPGNNNTSIIRQNTDGYMYENFHSKARQAEDNNYDKPVAIRASIMPIKDIQFGGSYLNAKWDAEDHHFVQYIFSHFLMDWQDITLVGEYGQIKFGTDNDGIVTQFSGYVAAGYMLLKDRPYIKSLQPVIRYELFDSWKEDPDKKGYRESISAGLRYSPFSGWVIKAAYQITREPYGPDLDNNGFSSEVVFEF